MSRPILSAFLALTFLLAVAAPSFAGDAPKELVGMWQVVLPAEMQAQLAEAEKAAKATPDDEMAKMMLEMMAAASKMKMEFAADGRIIAHMGDTMDEAKWSATSTGPGAWSVTTTDKEGNSESVAATVAKDGVLTIQGAAEGEPPLQFTRVKPGKK